MATHSSILAWKILQLEEPGRLQSMGSQIVRHDWLDMTEETSPTCTRAPRRDQPIRPETGSQSKVQRGKLEHRQMRQTFQQTGT